MGQDQSAESGGHTMISGNDLYMPVSVTRMESEREVLPQPISIVGSKHRLSLLKTAFASTWSVEHGKGIGPSPRTGHFYAYDPNHHIAYIGYGTSNKQSLLSDVWSLDTINYEWKEIHLTGNPLSPRSGSCACMIGNHLLIFGGYSEPNYLGELHTIDVTNGKVELVHTNGPEPSPRTFPVCSIYGNKFFVWGGFNGEWPSSLYYLDFSNWTWTELPTDIKGRAAAPYTFIKNKIYVFGASSNKRMIEIDMENPSIQMIQTHGAEPLSTVISGGMISVENFLIYFGGKSSSPWTLVYAYDVIKKWWFVFHVVPDNETTTLADGNITESGLFMLPRLSAFSVFYEASKKQIIATLGEPITSPVPLFILSIGPALAQIHLRDDMDDMFHRDSP